MIKGGVWKNTEVTKAFPGAQRACVCGSFEVLTTCRA